MALMAALEDMDAWLDEGKTLASSVKTGSTLGVGKTDSHNSSQPTCAWCIALRHKQLLMGEGALLMFLSCCGWLASVY